VWVPDTASRLSRSVAVFVDQALRYSWISPTHRRDRCTASPQPGDLRSQEIGDLVGLVLITYELGAEALAGLTVAAAFDELAGAL
jgi:hypothetical protein